MTKSDLEVLTGKALSVWLEFVDETDENVFCYKCKLSLALLYLADMFINKLKTKFNSFLQNGFKYKENSQLLLKKFLRRSSTNAFKSFICRQENATAVRSLRAKIVIVGNSK